MDDEARPGPPPVLTQPGQRENWLTASLTLAAQTVLLTGPTVLAFFAGGYFAEAQSWAGLAAWMLVAAGMTSRAALRPRTRAGWVALAGISLLAAWTLASIAWAPVAGGAYHAGQLALLYTGMLLAAILLLRSGPVQLWVEPVLALGTLVVIGYGLSGRMLPGLLHFARSVSAQGRLEQPLTYWNAMGELAAIGLVLCARLAGTPARPEPMRRAALAACVPLGLGLYLSFSRGALFACLAGLLALVVAAPWRSQLRAVCLSVAAGGLMAAAAAPLAGVTSLSGSLPQRERQGAIVLAVLIILSVGAALLEPLAHRRREGRLPLPRRATWLALLVICAGMSLAIAVGAKEGGKPPSGAEAGRLASFQSNRYAYWDVALRAFAAQPVRGVGAGGWAVWWLRYRTVNEFAQDAHSLPLQTMAELGLVGLLFLGMLCGGLAAACRTAHRVAPSLAAGPAAALVAYAAHAPLDWDWQMPAVTLVAFVLAGLVVALAEST
ncbi:MAG TPA: O-antigen ligase family protein [Solirubrobacteraceae bacterium]|nr:O-antigen ligase family protein [Solirubrobacteraceae bacterium]